MRARRDVQRAGLLALLDARVGQPARCTSRRAGLLALLDARVGQLARRRPPYRRVGYAEVIAVAAKLPAPACTSAGAAPAWMLALAVAANLGMGERGHRRGARQRLALLLAVSRKLAEWRGGLRFEELCALLPEVPEDRLWALLRWAQRERVLLDLGERGWFVDSADGTGPGSTAELRRAARDAA